MLFASLKQLADELIKTGTDSPVKRKPGRPPKVASAAMKRKPGSPSKVAEVKRKPGSPSKVAEVKRKPGRPPKVAQKPILEEESEESEEV